MIKEFFKFPSTPHLAALPGVEIRGDKVMTETERAEFLQHVLIVEEKMDGANLGISFDAERNIQAQSRGAYLQLPESGQWKSLGEWLTARADLLFEHLMDRYVLFGEWCFAKHSVFYGDLPDWFLSFDIYDREACRFLSTVRRDQLISEMRLAHVPVLAQGRFSLSALTQMLSQAGQVDHPIEGLYLRYDQGEWLGQRAKLVRPAFIQSIDRHWSRLAIVPNRLQ